MDSSKDENAHLTLSSSLQVIITMHNVTVILTSVISAQAETISAYRQSNLQYGGKKKKLK
jgi:hypothetical protein